MVVTEETTDVDIPILLSSHSSVPSQSFQYLFEADQMVAIRK